MADSTLKSSEPPEPRELKGIFIALVILACLLVVAGWIALRAPIERGTPASFRYFPDADLVLGEDGYLPDQRWFLDVRSGAVMTGIGPRGRAMAVDPRRVAVFTEFSEIHRQFRWHRFDLSSNELLASGELTGEPSETCSVVGDHYLVWVNG
ncbi:MAG: hypothetical protein AAFU85_24885, partial [Planctomycetota bacterium]